MRKWSLLGAFLLGACASVHSSSASDEAINETKKLVSGNYASPSWVNEAFSGTHVRQLTNNRLAFSVLQTEHGGGWDTGIGLLEEPDHDVAALNPETVICFRYDLDFEPTQAGKWWVGPKISVNWAAMIDAPSTGEWYENYVVEMANQTPKALEADLFDFFDAEFLGESEIAGATYRHVKLRFNDWWQYWSIRQDYRSEGVMPIKPVVDAWIGLPDDLPFDGVKANIETHGHVSGSGTIQADIATHLTGVNCK